MDARCGGARSPNRARAHRSAVPPGPLARWFQLERSGRGDGPHLWVRNGLSCGGLLAARQQERSASGPFSANRAKLVGGSLPCGYRPHRLERGVIAVACRRASSHFGGLANVDTAFNVDRERWTCGLTLGACGRVGSGVGSLIRFGTGSPPKWCSRQPPVRSGLLSPFP